MKEELIKSYLEERNILLNQLKEFYKYSNSNVDEINTINNRLKEIDRLIFNKQRYE